MSTKNGYTLIETVISLLIISCCAIVLIEVRENSAHLLEASKTRITDAAKVSILAPYSKSLTDSVLLKEVLANNYAVEDNDIKAFLSDEKCSVKNKDGNTTLYNQNNMPIMRLIENTITVDGKETKLYRLTGSQK